MKPRGSILIAAFALAAAPTFAFADLLFGGAEFIVNTYVTQRQYAPAISMDDDGDFVVVWTSADQDGSTVGVFGQRFDSGGAKAGPEFQVNTYAYNSQYVGGSSSVPEGVSMDDDGDFVVAWTSFAQEPEPFKFTRGVFGQKFSGAGAKVGPEFHANVYLTGDQRDAFVGLADNGTFVVTWNSTFYQDGDSTGVFGRRPARDRTAEIAAAQAIDTDERSWLSARIDADHAIDEYEQALMDFLAEEGGK